MTELISIIVPIYNTEKYLRKCAYSVFEQTYSNFELILINDGSTDNSGKICDQLRLLDQRVRVSHGQNAGVACARNKGLDLATGSLICFLDSDDYMSPTMLERLKGLIVEYDADIAMCSYRNVRSDEEVQQYEAKVKVDSMNNMQAISKLFDKKSEPAIIVTSKLYRRSITNQIRFPQGRNFEDVYVTYQYYHKANRVILTNEELYYRIKRNDSVTGLPFGISRLDALVGRHERVIYLKNNNMPELYQKAAYKYLLYIMKCYRRFKNNPEIEPKVFGDLKKKYKKEYKYYSILKQMPLRKRINLYLFYVSPEIHAIFEKAYVYIKKDILDSR